MLRGARRFPPIVRFGLAGVLVGLGLGLWIRTHPPALAPSAPQVVSGTPLPATGGTTASWGGSSSGPARVAAGSSTSHDAPAREPRESATLPPLSRAQLLSFPDVAEMVTPAVVTISSEKSITDREEFRFFHRFFGNRDHPALEGHGSGFIIESNGTILTNNHVVGDADKLTVKLSDGREFDARIAGRDEQTDLAVVRIDATGLPTVRLGDSDEVRVGEWVLAIGSPFDLQLEHTVTAGIISGKGRSNVRLAEYEDFLQTDAAINPGNSGGPLVNLHGEVIGINTAIATHNGGFQGVSFAIPIDFARSIVERLLSEGKVTRAWLGVTLDDVSSAQARELGLARPEGVLVKTVTENSPAERAGLRNEDLILAMDGKPAESVSRFRNRVSLCRPGQHVALGVLRGGRTLTMSAELGRLTDEVLAAAEDAPESNGGQEFAEIGVQIHQLNPELRRQFELDPDVRGVLVADVVPETPAARAGLQAGDLIIAVNRKSVESLRDFQSAMERTRAGHDLVLRVKRGGQSILVTLERPS
jgi:serine protease Do